jgi:hypothetical protein
MARYRFTGDDVTVFPSIVLPYADGFKSLVATPGETYDIDDTVEVDHPHLVKE